MCPQVAYELTVLRFFLLVNMQISLQNLRIGRSDLCKFHINLIIHRLTLNWSKRTAHGWKPPLFFRLLTQLAF